MTVDIEKLTEPFPRHAIKQRKGGGGRMLDYVETHTVIHRLNTATGNQWNFRVISMERDGDILRAVGELEIPGLGARQGIGVQRLQDKSEDLAKGVLSDALKKAATLFGVGLELYGPDYESGELPAQPQQRQRPVDPARDFSKSYHEPEVTREDIHAEMQRQTQAQNPAQPVDPNAATLAQKKKIFAASREHGWTADEIKDTIVARYGVDSTHDLTKQQASELIDLIEQGQPA